MRGNAISGAILAAMVPLATGCSSSYLPAASPRLSLVMEGGTYAYVRDGKKYDGGFLGGDVEEAVQGSPKAEAYAHAYTTGVVTGFALTMLGVAGVLGGATVTGLQADARNGQNFPTAGVALMGAGLVTEIVGVLVTASSLPHLFDAVNAYNDDLRRAGDPPAAPSPTYAP